MRARQLGIAVFVVLALLGASGCGDDSDADDAGTGTEGDDVDASGGEGDANEDVESDGDEGEDGGGEANEDGESDGDEGEAGGDGGVDDGGSSTLTSYADAEAIAAVLDCDAFEPAEAPPVGPGSPSTESLGFCTGRGGEPMIAVFAEEDMGDVRAGVDAISCQMLPDFVWIVGANWLVTPNGEPDPAVNDEIAATLGGELLPCS